MVFCQFPSPVSCAKMNAYRVLRKITETGGIFLAATLFSIFYNTALTIVLTLAACCAYFLYRRQRRPLLIAILTLFAVYLADNTIVFCTELVPEFATLYDRMFLVTPSIKTICFITLIGSLLFALHCVLPAFTLKQMGLLLGLYGAVLICVPMISQRDWMVFFYYFITQLLTIGISSWGLVALRRVESSFDRGMLKRFFLYFLCMSLLILAEDSFVIFFRDRYYGPRLKINNRNLSENLMYLGLSLPVFRYTATQLKQSIPAAEAPAPQPPEPDRQQLDLHTFSCTYNLTEREQEILYHLLQSKSQQEISEELVIALGTVKTHIHNIYQKTDSASRNHIIAKYREFCALRHPDSPAPTRE